MKTCNLETKHSEAGQTIYNSNSNSNWHKPKEIQKELQKDCYRTYSPKIRQQVISNKLLNSQLYELYTVRKLHCGGKWLKDNIVDGTIKIAKQTYIISWLDILPIDAFKEEAVVLSLRSPKYKDKNTKEYSLSYAVVTKP